MFGNSCGFLLNDQKATAFVVMSPVVVTLLVVIVVIVVVVPVCSNG